MLCRPQVDLYWAWGPRLCFCFCYQVKYETALAAVFIEGWIFVLLAVTGVRTKLIRMVPKSIMLATSAGIGMFLAFIGLQHAEGLGVVTYDAATLVTLGKPACLC
jgi:adenine/guanine/hypoxanthine permease